MTKIGVDIDEVLAETVEGFLEFFNDNHGTQYKYEDISDYSFGKQFGLATDEEKQEIQNFFASTYFPILSTVTGSVAAITILAENHELYAVSSRPEQLMPQTKAWLETHYPNSFKEIILTNSHLDSTRTKSEISKKKKLDIFIEDQIRYAEDCSTVCSTVFLLDKPWNQTNPEHINILRVKTWEEILNILKQ